MADDAVIGSPVEHDESAWTRSDLPETRAWVRSFDEDMLEEIDAAVRRATRDGGHYGDLTPDRFPLPRTGELLRDALADLESGRGFTVLGGFPVDRYSLEENTLAHCGLSSHLGAIVAQNHKLEKIIEVVDREVPYSHQSRGYHSNKLLPFHTDGADWAGLMCLGTAAEGGLSVIASAVAVHNAVLAERPDLYEVLCRGFYHHRRGEQAPGEPPVSAERIPVFSVYHGLLHCIYNRNPIDWVVHEGIALDEIEVAALDFLDAVVARPELQLHMELRKGDIQYINNFVILHSRGEYRDSEKARRHLLRIWLDYPEARRVGPTLLDLYAPDQIRKKRAL